MPNVKILVDDSIWKDRKEPFVVTLEPIRGIALRAFECSRIGLSACANSHRQPARSAAS